MNQIDQRETNRELSLLKMPGLRATVAGMMIGASTLGSTPAAYGADPTPVDRELDVTALAQQGRLVPAGPKPTMYGAGRIDGFGMDGERCLTVYESGGKRFIDPPFAFYTNEDRGIRFAENVPAGLQRQLLDSRLSKIVQSVSFEPGLDEKGKPVEWSINSSIGTIKSSIDLQIRVSESQRPMVAEAHRITQLLNGQQTRYNPSMWLPLEIAHAPVVYWNKTTNETLGYGAPKIAEGTGRATFHFEQTPKQFEMTRKAKETGDLFILPLFGARGHINAAEGKMTQTAEKMTQSREQIKLELGKLAKDGLVSLDDIKRIEAILRTRIGVDIETTDAKAPMPQVNPQQDWQPPRYASKQDDGAVFENVELPNGRWREEVSTPSIQLASMPVAIAAGAAGTYLADKAWGELARKYPVFGEIDCKVGAGIGYGINVLTCPQYPSNAYGAYIINPELLRQSQQCNRDAINELRNRWDGCTEQFSPRTQTRGAN